MLVGIDDTDSLKGMCTTFLATTLCKKLKVKSTPLLIRLNPNIPFKTRGNGAICFRTNKKNKDIIIETVKKHMHLKHGANPGIVFLDNENSKTKLSKFYARAVREILDISDAEKTAKNVGAKTVKFGNGRGIIGALAAIGAVMSNHTYELIAYRKPNRTGVRMIDENSVYQMHLKLFPKIFDSIDKRKNNICITPKGKDPVFCGIRGISKNKVLQAWDMIKPLEKIDCIQVFKTNQATDVHYKKKKMVDVKPYDCVKLTGTLSVKPKTIQGGHIIFKLSDGKNVIDCAAFKKTFYLPFIAKQLEINDRVSVYGCLDDLGKTVNIEKIHVLSLTPQLKAIKPVCCGKNMTSKGQGKGYFCKKCKKKSKIVTTKKLSRNVKPGWYEATPDARRHLSRPLILDGIISPEIDTNSR